VSTTEQQAWPLGKNLVEVRGRLKLNVAQASKKLGVDRQTWTGWEQGRQRPKQESLHAIVETFGCPPELVGYEPPKGWTLVPEGWISKEFEEIKETLSLIREDIAIR
jgi:transcriptional regulator with XRE-family HTH domain